MLKNIALIGVGLMGSALAKHMLEAGFSVTVHDLDPAKVDAIVALGGKKSGPVHEIAQHADVIMLSLPNSRIVNAVVLDQLRLLDTGRQGLILIDASTADPGMSTALALQLRENGIDMLDATITGTSDMAKVKDIVFLVGGKEETYAACLPVFAAMSKESIYMGENGLGAITKLVVNLVLGVNRMALAEGLTLAKKAGIRQKDMLEVLKKSAAYSKIMDQKGTRMVNRQFLPPSGHMAVFRKDVQLMLDLGARVDCPLPLISLHMQALTSEVAKGRGDWDTSDIISFYDGIANVQSAPE